MSKYLYILCEGDLDDVFYERICERVTGTAFERPGDFKLRNGSNWKAAIAGARLLMNRVRHWNVPQDIGIVIAVDNDRAPGHPGASPAPGILPKVDREKPPRYPALYHMIEEALGRERQAWVVDVALAVPVEMVESWVLVLLDPACGEDLPLFAEASQRSAKEYHGGAPPPQLKDLAQADQALRGMSKLNHLFHAAEQDLEAAAAVSLSLAMFLKDLRGWRRGTEGNS